MKHLNKKQPVFLDMPRSRRFRKSQNQVKPEWGKNNPQTKAKNKKLMIYIGIIAIAIVIGASLLAVGLSGMFAAPSSSPSPSLTPTPSPIPVPTPTVPSLTTPAGEYSSNGTIVLLETSMGNVFVQLRDDKPITSGNFEKLAQEGKYDNTIFHRVIANFMIQGGDPTGTGYGDSSIPNIPDEIGNDNVNARGTIAMANTGQPNSASSQFFINTVNNGANSATFDSSYTVFGTVIQGMDVVDAISRVATTGSNGSPADRPLQAVTLIKATVLP